MNIFSSLSLRGGIFIFPKRNNKIKQNTIIVLYSICKYVDIFHAAKHVLKNFYTLCFIFIKNCYVYSHFKWKKKRFDAFFCLHLYISHITFICWSCLATAWVSLQKILARFNRNVFNRQREKEIGRAHDKWHANIYYFYKRNGEP